MSRAAKFKQADVTRLVKGALRAGLAFHSFKVAVENGALRGMEPNQLFVEVWDHYERTCRNEPHARTRR